MTARALLYGAVPVPWTVSWSAEEALHVGHCPHFRATAICQPTAQGEGRPCFGKPHMDRQRQAIACGLCDLCAKPLKATTKVSLSHARVRLDGAQGPCVMQVEPLLHRACAATSIRHCPSLKRDVRNGSLRVRQVTRYQVQCARMTCAYVQEVTGQAIEALGHAKVVLLAWVDRDEAWLEAAA